MESTDVQPVSGRVRPWIRRLAIFVLPPLAAFCGIAVWDYIETSKLTHEIDAIRAKGEPVTIGPLARRSYDKGEKGVNADFMYSAAALLSLASAVIDESAPRGNVLTIHSRFIPVRQWIDGAAQRPALAELEGITRTLMSEWHEPLSLVDRAAAQPFRGAILGGDYPNGRIAGFNNLARLLSARTIGLSLAGDGDAAVDSAISAIRLRRAIRPGQRWLPVTAHEVPTVLSLARPSEQALERLQTTLANEEDPDGPTQDFVDTRARLLNDVWLRLYRVTPGTPLPPAFPAELLPSPQMRPRITRELVRSMRVWSELLAIARKPWPERARLAAEPIARYANEKFERGGLNGVLAAVSLFSQTVRPDLLIHDRASRIAVAVERYRRVHADALPATVNDLVPKYLESIPEDPLTGQPLRYRVTSEAYMVYSVGPDGNDDGGNKLRTTPPLPTVEFPPGADMGIRVLIQQ